MLQRLDDTNDCDYYDDGDNATGVEKHDDNGDDDDDCNNDDDVDKPSFLLLDAALDLQRGEADPRRVDGHLDRHHHHCDLVICLVIRLLLLINQTQ